MDVVSRFRTSTTTKGSRELKGKSKTRFKRSGNHRKQNTIGAFRVALLARQATKHTDGTRSQYTQLVMPFKQCPCLNNDLAVGVAQRGKKKRTLRSLSPDRKRESDIRQRPRKVRMVQQYRLTGRKRSPYRLQCGSRRDQDSDLSTPRQNPCATPEDTKRQVLFRCLTNMQRVCIQNGRAPRASATKIDDKPQTVPVVVRVREEGRRRNFAKSSREDDDFTALTLISRRGRRGGNHDASQTPTTEQLLKSTRAEKSVQPQSR